MMDSKNISGTTEKERNSQFLSAEDLLDLRNPTEELPQSSVGPKFSEHSNASSESPQEKLAVESALENCKEILSKKNGAKICDLMQGEWKEELKVTVTTKLKRKFVQHMGHIVDDQIHLYPEESLFLLENGCLEIVNGVKPMSTEEAYATILKGDLSLEKYQVYSHLTYLGFIVIPHQENLISKIHESEDEKTCQSKRKRILTPSDESCNKRLTFTGVFSEEKNTNQTVNVPNIYNIEQTESIDLSIENEINVIHSTSRVECSKKLEQKALPLHSEPVYENVLAHSVESLPNVALENTLDNATPNEVSHQNTSKVLEPQQSIDIEEMDADSQSTEISLGASERSREAFESGVVDEASTGTTPLPSQDSQCNTVFTSKQPLVTEDNSEIISCSSESQIIGEASRNDFSKSEYIDDEITLLEVTRKESTVTAVIDLLSDESSNEDVDVEETSVSDNEIQVRPVQSTSSDDKKDVAVALNLKKIKSKKISDCKLEETSAQVSQDVESLIQFPDVYRKEVTCVPQPPQRFLPNNVKPCKEVYVLNIPRMHVNLPGIDTLPQSRVWNSFRDVQEYQRARRQSRYSDRHSPRFHGRDNQFRHNRYSKLCDDRSGRSDSNFRDRAPDSCRNDRASNQRHIYTHYDRLFSWRHDEDYHNSNSSFRDRPENNRIHYSILNDEEDIDYRNRLPCDERKPLRPTNSPVINGTGNDPRTCPWDSSFQSPELQDSASFSSAMSARHPGMALNYPNPSSNPLNMSQHSQPVPNIPFMGPNDYATEVQRTAYSFATTMVSSILGPNFSLNNSNFPPFHQNWNNNQLRMPFPGNINNTQNFNIPIIGSDHSVGQNNWFRDYSRRRRTHRGNPFPCSYRNVSNKRSWNDVRATVQESEPSSSQSNQEADKPPGKRNRCHSQSDTSDVEEIPINKNEFLWNSTDLCPLVMPGIQHPVKEVLKLLKIEQTPESTDESSKNEPSQSSGLNISFDVYLPNSKFKKSSPGVPKHRIVVRRLLDPLPQVSDIELLQNEFNDGAMLQFAIVDNKDVNFISANNFLLPDIIPFEDK